MENGKRYDQMFTTSDEVAFMRSLDRAQLKLYWWSLKRRKFPEEINRRVVINQTIRRLRESGEAIR